MARPRLFIGSATESLDIAYAAQEALEHDAEVTVWSQGIFDLSKYTLDALVDLLDEVDFGLFVLTPSDITTMRDQSMRTVRDNVVFELGMFIGRLGRERSFIVVPRKAEELHLPTDLLGITPGLYDADRTDNNLVAALGPATNKIRRALKTLGPVVEPAPTVSVALEEASDAEKLIEAETDCLGLIEAWMGGRPSSENTKALRYSAVDRELGMKPGSAKKYIITAARRWNYAPSRVGEDIITFT